MKRVLVVDDNEDLADGLSMLLDDEGYEVAAAYNGEMALKKATAEGFDIAFVDIKLPDTNGVDLLAKLRELYPDKPVILMTGFRIEQVLETVSNGKQVSVLRAPAAREELLEKIQQLSKGFFLIDNQEGDYLEWLQASVSQHSRKVAIVSGRQQAEEALRESPDVIIYNLEHNIATALADYVGLREQLADKTVLFLLGEKLVKDHSVDPLRSLLVTGCIYKPFDPDQVMEILNQAA